MFSPSPEHEPVSFDRNKLMMMSSINTKRERESPKSEKSDRRSTTPIKKEKHRSSGLMDNSLSMKSQSQHQQQSSDKNKHHSGALPNIIGDSKKRPYSEMDHELSRDSKARKVDQKPLEFQPMLSKAQPIETNPDAVKSLLQECFKQESNKFDINGDSPLDVLTPIDPTGSLGQMPTLPIAAPLTMGGALSMSYDHHLPAKIEPIDNNGTSDEYSSSHKKHSKSKKNKKDKHKKKKKHKSDREDRDEDERRERDAAGPLKFVLAKEANQPSLKIKIPINQTEFRTNQPMQPAVNATAPLKLKISKDKIIGDVGGNESSSSSHKKHKDKDKDRERHSKKSKHNNNNSDGYHMSHQQHHYSIGKVS